ncbi:hypothetical protein ACFLU3_00715 [Chloroflexota bacterium]
MSKNPKPTTEELRFVYDLLTRGHEEADVLAEYARLYDDGQLMFPFRSDKRFVRDRKRELDAATEVLKDHLKKVVDPVISERRKEHSDHLAAITGTLLSNGIDTVDYQLRNLGVPSDGWIYILNDGQFDRRLTQEELSSYLIDNEDTAQLECGSYDFECLIHHLIHYYPDIAKVGFGGIATNKPYELIETLQALHRGKIFAGNCPVCKEWQ